MTDAVKTRGAPPRFEQISPLRFVLVVTVLAGIVLSFTGTGFSLTSIVAGLPNIGVLLGNMFPPDVSRLNMVLLRLLETFQMAIAGTVIGIVLSLPVAILASRTHSPHPVVSVMARSVISLFRTIPDLIWALIFVVAVGLGPQAGTLAIAVDTIGFCGRFFAEAIEEADQAPQEALRALGASPLDIIGSVVLPAAMPSMVATSLFNLEKATRASVVLGIVGAGGIGMELQVALDLFNYPQAATIILAILVLVVVVEYLSGLLRMKIIKGSKD